MTILGNTNRLLIWGSREQTTSRMDYTIYSKEASSLPKDLLSKVCIKSVSMISSLMRTSMYLPSVHHQRQTLDEVVVFLNDDLKSKLHWTLSCYINVSGTPISPTYWKVSRLVQYQGTQLLPSASTRSGHFRMVCAHSASLARANYLPFLERQKRKAKNRVTT